jgi:hypothetical protein
MLFSIVTRLDTMDKRFTIVSEQVRIVSEQVRIVSEKVAKQHDDTQGSKNNTTRALDSLSTLHSEMKAGLASLKEGMGRFQNSLIEYLAEKA